MTSYDPPTDAELASGKPITSGKNKRLRDMAIAIIEGAPGAPRATSRIITPGGAASDGILIASTTLTGPGYYDFASAAIAGPITFPWLTVMRVDGNFSCSSTIRVGGVNSANLARGRDVFGMLVGTEGRDESVGAGAGSSVGNGGSGSSGATPTTGHDLSGIFRFFCAKRLIIGAPGGDATSVLADVGGLGGGALLLLVHGNLDLTGGTIDASGYVSAGPGSSACGGSGAGGSVIVVCTGTITGGTYRADGADGRNSGGGGQHSGGGGGGYVALIATAFAGSRTKSAAGGASGGGGSTAGSAGLVETDYTLTEAQINAMLLR